MSDRITMVKKRFADGSTCGKCEQAQELLQRRGVWDRIDEVVWADEADASSRGMLLAKRFDVSLAPFFLVGDPDGDATVYTSALKLFKAELKQQPAAAPSAAAVADESLDIDAEEPRLAALDPIERVRWTLERFGAATSIAFSGAEDVAVVDMAVRSGLPFRVFCLDTGRLHAETYRYIDRVRSHYDLTIELMAPDTAKLEAFVRDKGLFSFYEDGHKECCGVRKIGPLRRALAGRPAWMTGQRRDQSPTRTDVPHIQVDPGFSTPESPLIKVNPLASWTSAQVWAYLRDNAAPFNPLHERGFKSIGCEPCTRPTHPGQHEREGRWWWEDETKRECGLHLEQG